MKRMGARSILLFCVVLWAGAIWALSVGAFANQLPPLPVQSCVPGAPPPLGCTSASPSRSASPSTSASPSEEPPDEADSEITIKYANKKFSGAVTSDEASCERNRAVSVKKRGGRVVGTDTTDSAGKYSVRYPNPKGKRYFAKVAPRVGGATTCNGDRSRTIKAP